jgi:hypothetical protein
MHNGWHYPLGSAISPSAGFLERNYVVINGASRYHLGIDYPAARGADVFAVADGQVVKKAYLDATWGYVYFIQHQDAAGTKFIVVYMHLDDSLAQGATVTAGQRIGGVFRDHLHLGLLPGTSWPLNGWGMLPEPYTGNTNGFVDPQTWFDSHTAPGHTPPSPPPPPPPAKLGFMDCTFVRSAGLSTDQSLKPGQYILSNNGMFVLIFQFDQNLVLYGPGAKPLWSSGTDGTGATTLLMQADGNLVLYSPTRAVWASGTDGTGASHALLQDDGNFVIYTRANSAKWSTGTSGHSGPSPIGTDTLGPNQVLRLNQCLRSSSGLGFLVLAADGNLIAYGPAGQTMWASHTNGKGATHAIMQLDGNLVLYTPANGPVWATNTAGQGSSRAVMQNDGNFVLYRESGGATWDTKTAGKLTSPLTSLSAPSDWQGSYFPNPNLFGPPTLVRSDPSINFDWGTGTPLAGGVPTDNFSVCWTKNVSFTQGTYRFSVQADDGIRLYIDGQLVIDKWVDQPFVTNTVEQTLSSGVHAIKLDYFEHGGNAIVKLWWDTVETPSTTDTTTPTTDTTTPTTPTTSPPTTDTTTPNPQRFTDVPRTHRYAAAINALADAKVIGGYADGTFRPQNPVLRAQFAKMAVLSLGLNVSEGAVPCNFRDVPKPKNDLYPDDYVAVAAQNRLIQGYSDGNFKPFVDVTRAQLLTIVVRSAERFKPAALRTPPVAWRGVLPAGDATHGKNIAKAEYNGLLSGINLGDFRITAPATRGEIAQILWNLRNR